MSLAPSTPWTTKPLDNRTRATSYRQPQFHHVLHHIADAPNLELSPHAAAKAGKVKLPKTVLNGMNTLQVREILDGPHQGKFLHTWERAPKKSWNSESQSFGPAKEIKPGNAPLPEGISPEMLGPSTWRLPTQAPHTRQTIRGVRKGGLFDESGTKTTAQESLPSRIGTGSAPQEMTDDLRAELRKQFGPEATASHISRFLTSGQVDRNVWAQATSGRLGKAVKRDADRILGGAPNYDRIREIAMSTGDDGTVKHPLQQMAFHVHNLMTQAVPHIAQSAYREVEAGTTRRLQTRARDANSETVESADAIAQAAAGNPRAGGKTTGTMADGSLSPKAQDRMTVAQTILDHIQNADPSHPTTKAILFAHGMIEHPDADTNAWHVSQLDAGHIVPLLGKIGSEKGIADKFSRKAWNTAHWEAKNGNTDLLAAAPGAPWLSRARSYRDHLDAQRVEAERQLGKEASEPGLSEADMVGGADMPKNTNTGNPYIPRNNSVPGAGGVRVGVPGATAPEISSAVSAAGSASSIHAALRSPNVRTNSAHLEDDIRAATTDGSLDGPAAPVMDHLGNANVIASRNAAEDHARRVSDYAQAVAREQGLSNAVQRRHKADSQHLHNLVFSETQVPTDQRGDPEKYINQESLRHVQRMAEDPSHSYHAEAVKRLAMLDNFRSVASRSVFDVLGERDAAARTASINARRDVNERGEVRDGQALPSVRTDEPVQNTIPGMGGSTIEAADPKAAQNIRNASDQFVPLASTQARNQRALANQQQDNEQNTRTEALGQAVNRLGRRRQEVQDAANAEALQEAVRKLQSGDTGQ